MAAGGGWIRVATTDRVAKRMTLFALGLVTGWLIERLSRPARRFSLPPVVNPATRQIERKETFRED